MLRVKIAQDIFKDGTIEIPMNGKLLKIALVTPNSIDTIQVKVESNDYETLFNNELAKIRKVDTGDNIFYILYPFNVVESYVAGEGAQTREDYFYIMGKLRIIIRGLGDREIISEVRVYYDDGISQIEQTGL